MRTISDTGSQNRNGRRFFFFTRGEAVSLMDAIEKGNGFSTEKAFGKASEINGEAKIIDDDVGLENKMSRRY